MTIHYHGTPITPKHVLRQLAGCHFCVPFSDPRDAQLCHDIGQSVMLDNGAFSIWRKAKADREVSAWEDYYRWVEKWLDCATTWAVIPDSIAGTEDQNDQLVFLWPFGKKGVPVWHMHESLTRLKDLCNNWPKVCIGSSSEYKTVGSLLWRERMSEAFDYICLPDGATPTWIHMLRGMQCVRMAYPFASVDSTDVARNHNLSGDAVSKARRWDGYQCPAKWRALKGRS